MKIGEMIILCIVILGGFFIVVHCCNQPHTEEEGIHVRGEATIEVKPDTLTIVAGVQEMAPTSKEVQETLNETIKTFVAQVKELGIKEENIKTSNYNVYPNYTWDKDTDERQIRWYEGSQNVTITLQGENFKELGEKVLNLAPSIGNMTIQNVQFSLKDTVKGQEEARQLALQYAREKAESIAKEMNISLGKVTSIVDNSYGGVFRATANTISASKMMAFEDADEEMAMGGVNLEQGTTEVTVSVNVSYAIK